MMKKNLTLINTISSLFFQVITIINGFIIPKIILNYFGSEVNGLVSSLGQFLNYISLIEGGVTGVVMASLYKPLYEKNQKKINSIVNTARQFFKKISFVFVIYSLILAFVYPFIVKTSFSFEFIFSLTMIMFVNLFVQYNFSLTYKTLLNADRKVYIVSLTQSFILILNIILSIISVKIYPSIHILKIISAILYISQPIIYSFFVNKYFNIDKNVETNKELLKSRWDGFSINIAAFIHMNTDIAILSLFANVSTVSIYSVYKLITNGLNQIINSISSALSPTIGHLYAKGNAEELEDKFETFEFIILFIVFLIFTIAGLLITPFVMIYTKNITDANYYQPTFGIFLIISEAIYLLKSPHVNLAYSAGKFKDMKIPAYIEAGLNIVISVLLVNKLGLIGIAIGTLVAMTFRTIFQVIFTKKIIPKRKSNSFFSKLLIFSFALLISIFICKFIIPTFDFTIVCWLETACVYSIICFIIYLLVSIIFYRKQVSKIVKYLK